MHLAASKNLFEQDTARLTQRFVDAREWTVHTIDYPIIDCSFSASSRTTMRLRLSCDNWNDDPPSIEILAADGSPLAVPPADPNSVFNRGPHPATGRPFICMRGSREYHTHPSHRNDYWDRLKSDSVRYSLVAILDRLWDAWTQLKE